MFSHAIHTHTMFKQVLASPSVEQKSFLKQVSQIVLKNAIKKFFKQFFGIDYSQDIVFYSKNNSPTTIETTLFCRREEEIYEICRYLSLTYDIAAHIIPVDQQTVTPPIATEAIDVSKQPEQPQTPFKLMLKYLDYETIKRILKQSDRYDFNLNRLLKIIELAHQLNSVINVETKKSDSTKSDAILLTTLCLSPDENYFIQLHRDNGNMYSVALQDKFIALLVANFGDKIIINQDNEYYLD